MEALEDLHRNSPAVCRIQRGRMIYHHRTSTSIPPPSTYYGVCWRIVGCHDMEYSQAVEERYTMLSVAVLVGDTPIIFDTYNWFPYEITQDKVISYPWVAPTLLVSYQFLSLSA